MDMCTKHRVDGKITQDGHQNASIKYENDCFEDNRHLELMEKSPKTAAKTHQSNVNIIVERTTDTSSLRCGISIDRVSCDA